MTDKIITVNENKSTFTLKNPNKRTINKSKIDGCKITSGIRCDWHFEDATSQQEIFVELKGTDISHAYSQIETTINSISKNIKTNRAFIVCSRCPMIDTKIQILKLKARKKNTKLVIKSAKCVETIESLIS